MLCWRVGPRGLVVADGEYKGIHDMLLLISLRRERCVVLQELAQVYQLDPDGFIVKLPKQSATKQDE
jgi:hypothetical protein